MIEFHKYEVSLLLACFANLSWFFSDMAFISCYQHVPNVIPLQVGIIDTVLIPCNRNCLKIDSFIQSSQ